MATHASTTSETSNERQSGGVTSRRLLLNAAPAALVLTGAGIGAAVAAHAAPLDAELIALCAEFEALERKGIAALAKDDEEQERTDAITKAIYHEQGAIVTAITAYRPVTMAGFIALANVAAIWMFARRQDSLTEGDYCDRLLRVLLLGLLGRTAV